MIKAIIFDLNGIFIQSPKLSERMEKDFNIPVSRIVPKLSAIMEKSRMPGAGKSFSYWQEFFDEEGIKLSESEFWEYWFKAEVPSLKMIDIAKDLKKQGIKVFILSNNFQERADYYGQYPWMREAVDKVYFSWQTGFVKPDIRAWQLVLDENNLQPEECLFFDDQEKNLKAAESIGIKSFVFTSEDRLKEDVEKYLL